MSIRGAWPLKDGRDPVMRHPCKCSSSGYGCPSTHSIHCIQKMCCVDCLPREKSGYYTADAASAAKVPSDKKFVMVIPPPNVTGIDGSREVV